MPEFLTALWNKLNKPIHFLAVGASIILFAPNEYRWGGYVFGAFGLAGVVEWLWKQAIRGKENLQLRRAIWHTICYLNVDEKKILKTQLRKGEQTFYLNWNDYHGIYATYDSDEYRRLVGIYKGLAEKGIIEIRTEDTIANCHCLDPAWSMLLRGYIKDPNYLAVADPSAGPK